MSGNYARLMKGTRPRCGSHVQVLNQCSAIDVHWIRPDRTLIGSIRVSFTFRPNFDRRAVHPIIFLGFFLIPAPPPLMRSRGVYKHQRDVERCTSIWLDEDKTSGSLSFFLSFFHGAAGYLFLFNSRLGSNLLRWIRLVSARHSGGRVRS